MLTFSMAGNPLGGPALKTLVVSVGGQYHAFTFDTTGKDIGNMGWTSTTWFFNADAITHLRPVTFYYKKDNPRGLPSEDENIGFIAQEVREVFPEAVSEGPDGYLDFNMHPVNVALVNAVKELKAENDALRQEFQQIKATLGM